MLMDGWRRVLPLLAIGGVVAVAVYGAGAIGDTTTTTTSTALASSLVDEEATTSRTLTTSTVARPPEEERAFRSRVEVICVSAHARLNEELLAAGVELERLPGDNLLYFLPATEGGRVAYDEAARRMMAETLPKLRALNLPASLRDEFQHLYELMEQYAHGEEAPFFSGSFWIHQVESESSLYHCTFALGR